MRRGPYAELLAERKDDQAAEVLGLLLRWFGQPPVIGEMAAGLAHEIRNPLSSISASVELVRESPALVPEENRLLGIVLSEVERLDDLARIGADIGDASVIEFSHHLFKERSWGAMAESETFAHLEHLRLAGRATSRTVDGQLHYAIER